MYMIRILSEWKWISLYTIFIYLGEVMRVSMSARAYIHAHTFSCSPVQAANLRRMLCVLLCLRQFLFLCTGGKLLLWYMVYLNCLFSVCLSLSLSLSLPSPPPLSLQVAIKMENIRTPHPQLLYEAKVSEGERESKVSEGEREAKVSEGERG
jgi:hypothetical protein